MMKLNMMRKIVTAAQLMTIKDQAFGPDSEDVVTHDMLENMLVEIEAFAIKVGQEADRTARYLRAVNEQIQKGNNRVQYAHTLTKNGIKQADDTVNLIKEFLQEDGDETCTGRTGQDKVPEGATT